MSLSISAVATRCLVMMTSCRSSTASATTWPRRRCGNSLSGSAHGTPHEPIRVDVGGVGGEGGTASIGLSECRRYSGGFPPRNLYSSVFGL